MLATLSAANEADALARFNKRAALAGVRATGTVTVRSARHLLWDVECFLVDGANADNAWVLLTSYGISPSAELGSVWQETVLAGDR